MKTITTSTSISTSFSTFVLAAAVAACVAGCALTGKADAMDVRYYNPEVDPTRLTSAAGARSEQGAAIELGRVTSGIHLREKIAYRDAAFEVGFYDDKRWTERPEVYVRRALARKLYEEHGMTRALAGQGPTVDVEVVSFEEVRGAAPAARIQLRVVIDDERSALFERTVTAVRPVARDAKGWGGFVLAISQALDAATEEVATEAERAARR